MNEIQAWLKDPRRKWDDGVALFRKYSKNQALYDTFTKRSKLRHTKTKLMHEMRLLAKRKDVLGVAIPGNFEVKELLPPEPMSPLPGLEEVINYPEVSYPPRIAKAIQERSKLTNQRDRLHRILTEKADSMTPAERKKNLKESKSFHIRAMEVHQFIRTWQETGSVPLESPLEPPALPKPQLSEAEKVKLEKQWKSLQRKRSKNKKFLKEWQAKSGDTKQETKIQYYQQLIEANQKELDRLASILGKKQQL